MRTRRGIYTDLNISTFKVKLEDTKNTFVFSSKLHLDKFKKQFEEHRNIFNQKIISRYRVDVDFKTFADVVLYIKIENRGFLILTNKGEKLCQKNLLLNGEKLTNRN